MFWVFNFYFFLNKKNPKVYLNNNDYLKLYNFNVFTSKKLITKNNLNFIFNYNFNYVYSFYNFNNHLLKNFFNFIKFSLKFNCNVLFIDSDYKMVSPLYNYIFGLKNIINNSDYFFVKKSFLTLNNQLFLYNFFLKKFKISLIIVLNYNEFKTFFKLFLNFNLPILSFVDQKIEPLYLDYYFYINIINFYFFRFFTYNYISSLIFNHYNFNFFIKKKNISIFFNKNNFLI